MRPVQANIDLINTGAPNQADHLSKEVNNAIMQGSAPEPSSEWGNKTESPTTAR